MQLALIRYEYNNAKKEYMVLLISEYHNKYILIDDSKVSHADATIIRKNLTLLSNYSVPNQIKWLKENCPEAYRGYKEIYTDRVKVLKTFDINTVFSKL